MSEQIVDEVEDLSQPAANGELVHWMEPKHLRVGPAGISVAAGVAFTVGVVAAVSVLALIHWLGPQRLIVPPRRRVRA
ncbi:MAG: hypothetical protein M3N05_00235 [Pseudomonadota bacterium]|nr:hypothetical protein [Pseudomonadota bacterium]